MHTLRIQLEGVSSLWADQTRVLERIAPVIVPFTQIGQGIDNGGQDDIEAHWTNKEEEYDLKQNPPTSPWVCLVIVGWQEAYQTSLHRHTVKASVTIEEQSDWLDEPVVQVGHQAFPQAIAVQPIQAIIVRITRKQQNCGYRRTDKVYWDAYL